MIASASTERVRAFGYFILALVYSYVAQIVAVHLAGGHAMGPWSELVERGILLLILLIGYGGMARAFERHRHPFRSMGLDFRPGWGREFGIGAALGWGMLLVSVLPTALLGGLVVTLWTVPRQFGMLGLDLLVLAVASLSEEVVFRGYPFQRLIEAVGPVPATLLASVLFALAHILNPGANRASLIVTVFSGWLLSAAYLRTRALWVCWGWHFAWNAAMGLLFGLPISGLTRFSPVIQSDTIGPAWITGGDYGPEGSAVAAVVLLLGIAVVFRVTRGYAHAYAQPVIVAAGIPVDLEAMSRSLAPHHSAPAGQAAAQTPAPPAGQTLVQINPAPPAALAPAIPRSPAPSDEQAPLSPNDPHEPQNENAGT